MSTGVQALSFPSRPHLQDWQGFQYQEPQDIKRLSSTATGFMCRSTGVRELKSKDSRFRKGAPPKPFFSSCRHFIVFTAGHLASLDDKPCRRCYPSPHQLLPVSAPLAAGEGFKVTKRRGQYGILQLCHSDYSTSHGISRIGPKAVARSIARGHSTGKTRAKYSNETTDRCRRRGQKVET